MNIYILLLLASLVSALNRSPSLLSPGVEPNGTLPPSSLDAVIHCASPAQHDPGRQMPLALDCLNVLTFILATTPNHDRPIRWSRSPTLGQAKVPYRRSSGSCQVFVRLTTDYPAPTMEIATFDQVIGLGLRLVASCFLNSSPYGQHWGGAAAAGLDNYLDVTVWGAPDSGGIEAGLDNETVALNVSGASVTAVSQT